MAGYDPKKAETYNKLRQQGLSEDQAWKQAGITPAEEFNYVINDSPYNDDGTKNTNRGQMGSFIAGTGTKTFTPFTAAEKAESDAYNKSLESSNFETVDYPVKANSRPSTKTPINYTTTSTEQVSGGGERTVISGQPQPNAASRALQPSIDAKQAEIDQFTKENPSNFARSKQGLPPLSPEENAARQAKFRELSQEKSALKNQQFDAQNPGVTTIIEKPNTTTNTSTTTYSTSSNNDDVEAPDSQDEALSRQEEARLDAQPDVVTGGGSRTRTVGVNADGTIVQGSFQETVNAPEPQQVPVQDSLAPGEEFVQNDAPEPQQVETFNEGESTITAVEQAPGETYYESGGGGGNEGTITRVTTEPQDVDADTDQGVSTGGNESTVNLDTDNNRGGNLEAATKDRAQTQAALQARFGSAANGDWRVKLRLAPTADYLYNSNDPGILAPLKASDGVVFPYMPSIQTTYNANYDSVELTHSNYRGQFYKSSSVGDIQMTGIFTAQDTVEANYMLAVIHFFKSATKMFYGQDAQRGAPPPLVYLIGLGQYQFSNHPCVIKSFSYNLPTDVDYIRTQPNNYGVNLLNRRAKTSAAPSNTFASVFNRLSNALDKLGNPLNRGAVNAVPSPGQVSQQSVNNTSNATYVPTKIELQLTLMPIQTRSQQSQQFSVKQFANGNLLKGGFW